MSKYIFKRKRETMTTYRRSTKGYEFISETTDVASFVDAICKIEDTDTFPQDNGIIRDQAGAEVYDPESPEYFDFVDYTYHLIDESELDRGMIDAMMIDS